MKSESMLWGLTRDEAEQAVLGQELHSVWIEVAPPAFLRGTELHTQMKVFGLRSLEGSGIQVILAHPQKESTSVCQVKTGQLSGNE